MGGCFSFLQSGESQPLKESSAASGDFVAAPSEPTTDNLQSLSFPQFTNYLKKRGVDLAAFDSNSDKGARTLRDLWMEVMMRTCRLDRYPDAMGTDGFVIRRVVQILGMEIQAEINGVQRFLIMTSEDNRRDLNQRVTTKMFPDEEPPSCFGRCLMQNFDLDENVSQELFQITKVLRHEEMCDSAAYPGLMTMYDMTTFEVRILNPKSSALVDIGLPAGRDFDKTRPGGINPSRQRSYAWVSGDMMQSLRRNSRSSAVSTSDRRQVSLPPERTMDDALYVSESSDV